MSVQLNRWLHEAIIFLFFAAIVTYTISAAAAPANDGRPPIHWDLTDLYTDDSTWRDAVVQVEKNIVEVQSLRGSITEDRTSLASVLDLISDTNKQAARVYVYAALQADIDRENAQAQNMLQTALALFNTLERATTYVAPEIEAIGESRIRELINEEPSLAPHKFRLYDILQRAPHTLDSDQIEILHATKSKTTDAQNAYRNAINKSVLWPFVTLESGQGLSLTPDTYANYRGISSRNDRKAIFDEFWQTWRLHEDRFGKILTQHVQSQNKVAELQNYTSALDQATNEDGMSPAIYSKLISEANQHLPSFHRYLKLRARLLKAQNHQYHDIYAAVSYLEQRFSIQDAKTLTSLSLMPYGDDYARYLQQGFNSSWMHPYPQSGKRSGAYTQNAAYDVHPYLLLNFNRRFNDVATFAHEWGHAVHARLSASANPFETYTYSPFVGELASVTNEILLQDHMLEQELSDEEYLYYIMQSLELIRGNFFRQVMFAEFELLIHEKAQSGEVLTGADYSALYLALLRKYHGHDQGVMYIDEKYGIEWAYIPHFYSNFYVYQNATSVTGATFFASRILAGNVDVKNNFISMLKAGGSDYPRRILNQAGLDLTKDAPYASLATRMNRLIDAARVVLDRMQR